MTNLNAAIIGVGHLGAYHAEKFHSLPGVNITAIVDVDRHRAEKFASRFDAKAYTDHLSLPSSIDLVSIVTPTSTHYTIAKDCLDAGFHTLLEKPIAQRISEAQSLIDLAETRDVAFQIGHLERFNSAIQALGDELKNPRFIETHRLAPYNIRGTDVDVVLDLMIHDIDIILNTTASSLIDIQAVGTPVITDELDIANARLVFANGCIANVTASRVSNKRMRKYRVFQENAYISLDLDKHNVFTCRKKNGSKPNTGRSVIETEEHVFEDNDSLLKEIRSFIQAIRYKTRPVVTGLDGKQALEVAIEIKKAIKKSAGRGACQGIPNSYSVGTIGASLNKI